MNRDLLLEESFFSSDLFFPSGLSFDLAVIVSTFSLFPGEASEPGDSTTPA